MKKRRRRGLSFEPTRGNTFDVLAGGEAFYGALREAMAAARREVLLASYLWEDDETGRAFLAEAAACARRGLRVCVLTDGVGSLRLPSSRLRVVDAAGGETAVFHPLRFPLLSTGLFRRNHRKILVVDGEVAFTGGFGFADAWLRPPPEQWWDVAARVRGPVVTQFRRVFARDWRRCGRTPLAAEERAAAHRPGPESLRLLPSRRGRPELLLQLTRAIRRARERAFVCSAYFVPGVRLRHVLRAAARRGIDVRLLLPGPRTDHFAVWSAGRRSYHALLAGGVRIFEYRRAFLHAKYGVVDDAWGYVGSSNLDRWSGRFNRESDLEVLSPGGLAAIEDRFRQDLAAAREITLDRWKARPLRLRLFERLFGWVDPFL